MTIGVDTARDLLSVADALRKQYRGVTQPVPFTRQDVLDAAYQGACGLACCDADGDKYWWAMLWLINMCETGKFALPETVDLAQFARPGDFAEKTNE